MSESLRGLLYSIFNVTAKNKKNVDFLSSGNHSKSSVADTIKFPLSADCTGILVNFCLGGAD